jgi:hypothetical protein
MPFVVGGKGELVARDGRTTRRESRRTGMYDAAVATATFLDVTTGPGSRRHPQVESEC